VDDKESPIEDKQKEINEMDDQQKDDDQIDPYHGKTLIRVQGHCIARTF
jgi:hypothetical protein